MTDITELAQREKFEAWWERTQHNGNPPRFGWLRWRDGEGYKVDDDDSELDGMWEAWKAASAELVEALEKALKSNEFLKGQLSELANFNPDWDKLEASYESWREIAAELLVAKDRIAELERYRTAYMEWSNKTDWVRDDRRFDVVKPLGKHLADVLKAYIEHLESRTVTIEPFRSFVTDADLAALHRFAECCDDPESGGHDLEKEQVRRLEAIGALQRSGRISYITDFGDVLISITAGIKVEGE